MIVNCKSFQDHSLTFFFFIAILGITGITQNRSGHHKSKIQVKHEPPSESLICLLVMSINVPVRSGLSMECVYTISLISSTVLSRNSADLMWVLVFGPVCLNKANRSLGRTEPSDTDDFTLTEMRGNKNTS